MPDDSTEPETAPGPRPRRSALALAALATAAVPGLDIVATRPPQSAGADFEVSGLLDAEGRSWIVRSPRHDAAGAALEGEVDLLAALAAAVDDGALPFEIPRPVGFAPLPEGGRAMVYRELAGRALPLEDLAPGPGLAADLGRALAALHELPASVVEDAGLPVYDADDYRRRRLAEVDEVARTGLVPAPLLRRWERALEDVALWRFRATPVHGDLAAEHVLVADDRVVGVIDFSDARVADPADDLAWLVAAAPEDALESILEAYALGRTERGDAHLVPRAQLASELALGRWLLHGMRHEDAGVVDDALAMLRELDDAVDGAPDIGAQADVARSAGARPTAAGTASGAGTAADDAVTEETPAVRPAPSAIRGPRPRGPQDAQPTQELPDAARFARGDEKPSG